MKNALVHKLELNLLHSQGIDGNEDIRAIAECKVAYREKSSADRRSEHNSYWAKWSNV